MRWPRRKRYAVGQSGTVAAESSSAPVRLTRPSQTLWERPLGVHVAEADEHVSVRQAGAEPDLGTHLADDLDVLSSTAVV